MSILTLRLLAEEKHARLRQLAASQLLERVESFGGGSPARPHPKLDLRIESERLPLSCWVNDFLDWPDGGVRRGSGDPPPV